MGKLTAFIYPLNGNSPFLVFSPLLIAQIWQNCIKLSKFESFQHDAPRLWATQRSRSSSDDQDFFTFDAQNRYSRQRSRWSLAPYPNIQPPFLESETISDGNSISIGRLCRKQRPDVFIWRDLFLQDCRKVTSGNALFGTGLPHP